MFHSNYIPRYIGNKKNQLINQSLDSVMWSQCVLAYAVGERQVGVPYLCTRLTSRNNGFMMLMTLNGAVLKSVSKQTLQKLSCETVCGMLKATVCELYPTL
jgi:hypothetical protein